MWNQVKQSFEFGSFLSPIARRSAIFTVALSAFAAFPLFAHHGTASSYDQTKTIKVTGTVKEFMWRNPHCELFVEGKDDAGNIVTYSIEMGSPNVLAGYGYTRKLLKPGDQVVVEMHPSFTNPTSGENLSRKMTINGKEMSAGSDNQTEK